MTHTVNAQTKTAKTPVVVGDFASHLAAAHFVAEIEALVNGPDDLRDLRVDYAHFLMAQTQQDPEPRFDIGALEASVVARGAWRARTLRAQRAYLDTLELSPAAAAVLAHDLSADTPVFVRAKSTSVSADA